MPAWLIAQPSAEDRVAAGLSGDQSLVRIGQRLRRMRHAQGKSLEVIAGLAGISAPYLSHLEHNVRPLYRVPLIVRLANALGVPPMELVRLAVEDYLHTGGGDTYPDQISPL